MHSGMKWSNDYLVLDAEQFTNFGDGQRIHVHRIKELIVPPIPSFPIKIGVLVKDANASPLALELSRRRGRCPPRGRRRD